MKRSHAQRPNFKVIESDRISTFRKDCTGSGGRDFVLSVGTGADANDILLEAVTPEPATVGVLFDGAYLGVGMLPRSLSHARRSPAGAFPAGSDVGSSAMEPAAQARKPHIPTVTDLFICFMVSSEWESYPTIPAWESFDHIYGWTGFATCFCLRLH